MKLEHHGIGRQRDRLLVDQLLQAIARNGGRLTANGRLDEQVCYEAVNAVHQHHVPPPRARAIIERKLQNPAIREALRDVFAAVAGFTTVDAVDLHVAHIRGIEHEKLLSSGRTVRVRQRPSYPALKDYMTMVLPQPPKKINVPSR